MVSVHFLFLPLVSGPGPGYTGIIMDQIADQPENANLDQRRKKALFRSRNRGFKEVDLIFGTFAAAEAMTLSAPELCAFEALLDAPDIEVYSWFTGFTPVPQAFDTPVFHRMKTLCNRKDPTWNV